MILKTDAKFEKKTDLLFQKWQEFGEFWSNHSKVSKIWTLIGPFYSKHITFDLKKYRGIIFHDTEESKEKLACDLENDTTNFANFYQSIRKSQ